MARIKQILTERQLRYREAVQQWKAEQRELLRKNGKTANESIVPPEPKTSLEAKLDLIERMKERVGVANVEWARKLMKDRLKSRRSYRKWRRAIIGKHPRF